MGLAVQGIVGVAEYQALGVGERGTVAVTKEKESGTGLPPRARFLLPCLSGRTRNHLRVGDRFAISNCKRTVPNSARANEGVSLAVTAWLIDHRSVSR